MHTTSVVQSVSGSGESTAALAPATAQDLSLTLATLAHDLRSPLTVIRAAAQLLDRQLQSASAAAEVMATHAARITQATTRLAAMVEYLHELAQAAAGHMPAIERRPTDLVALARRVAEEQELVWGGRVITVTSATAEVVGVWDAGQLARVLTNLLANALKYSDPDTPVSVGVGREGAMWARLVVRDAGIGIPAADLPHVFTPFYRGANAAVQADGKGIGLASVRTLVAQHGGTVAVASDVGRGTTVTVRLPLQLPNGT